MDTKNEPLITVITATHNRSKLLKKAIESVLNQTVKDFEYVIVDDASTDNTKEVVKKYKRKDKRIRYILNKQNPAKTHCRPLNVGIKEARGKYICYLDDDNEYYPYHLEVLIKAFDDPKLDVAYCDMMVEDEQGNQAHGIFKDFDHQFLMIRNFIDTSEVMHKRDVVFAVGGWDEKVTRFTDWNLWIRMCKWGAKFKRVPIVALKYFAHGGDTQSKRTEVESWFDRELGITMFKPPFDPVGDFIFRPYLGERKEETEPKVAIFTLTYQRIDYTKRMHKSMTLSADYPFDWWVFDQGSGDGTENWLMDDIKPRFVWCNGSNAGITKGSNYLIDKIKHQDYQIIVKVDNDCEFLTHGWLHTLVDLWKRNHKLYMSPYPEGLVHNPGGAQRIGYSYIGPYFIEVTQHIGGLCAFIDARAYDDFRWDDQFKHGNQDGEASRAFRLDDYMPCYIPLHRLWHIDTTAGQALNYPEYFERRKLEKTEVA